MTSFNFLQIELKEISVKFPQVHIRYGYNRIINTHIVELLPIEEYFENAGLDNEWIPLSFKFREMYPDEEIAFISSDSTLRLDETLYEFNNEVNNCDIVPDFLALLSNMEMEYTFPTTIPSEPLLIGYSITNVLSSPEQNISHDPNSDSYYQIAA